MPNEQDSDAVRQFLAAGLEEVSPPGGLTHRQGQQLHRQRLCADDYTRMRFLNWLRDRGATDIKLGADGKTVWWLDPENGGRAADLGFTPDAPAGRWEPLEDGPAAQARALEQAMADLLEYARATDSRDAGMYEPERFAQEIRGLGILVDKKLAVAYQNRMVTPHTAADAIADMFGAQGEMEDAAALARDAESLFYDIQAHTKQVEQAAITNLVGKPDPLGGAGKVHSATSAAKAVDLAPEVVRHSHLVRLAGRVKAHATDLYGISRRRLRTAQKAVDTFTGKSDDE